ncbi:MAG: putative metal-binding motif-containing protein [Sandaracinaceae bacterium]
MRLGVRTRFVCGLALAIGMVGCDDGEPPPSDAGPPPPVECAGDADGTACGTGGAQICLGGACVDSTCGDGFVDEAHGEECDDGNEVAFDGCDPPSCTLTCGNDTDCDDGLACNGVEQCDVGTYTCGPGTPQADGTACSTTEVADGVCGSGVCLEPGCGNAVTEPGESCDDGADGDPDDGCTDTCTFSCIVDPDCDDSDVCNGNETCDLTTHVCQPATDLDCDDASPCTTDTCDATSGCVHALIDVDMDGFASDTLGSCGTDCDDMDNTSYPMATELCDTVDHDCNGDPNPPVVPFWFPDCDGDDYAPIDAAVLGIQACMEPVPGVSCAGGWTSRRPQAAMPSTVDCNDGDAMIRPGVAERPGDEVDQNCDGAEICYEDDDDDGYRRMDGRTVMSTDTDCTDMGEAVTADPATDCNDGVATTHPTAPELCNGVDDDCSGTADMPPLSCVLGSTMSCMQCGYSGTATCNMTCNFGACGGFAFNVAYQTGPGLTHACGYACAADWCSDTSTADCFVITGGPGAMVPPGQYEAEFYGGYTGMFDFYVDVNGTEVASMLNWMSPGTGFPRVIVPFTVTGCGTVTVRQFAHEFASMRLYTLTIRRVGD